MVSGGHACLLHDRDIPARASWYGLASLAEEAEAMADVCVRADIVRVWNGMTLEERLL